MKKRYLMAAFMMIAGCTAKKAEPQQPAYKEAMNREDAFVISLDGRKNEELADAFVSGKTDSLTTVMFTIEGDPVFHEVTRLEEGYRLVVDGSQDRFGSGKTEEYERKYLQDFVIDMDFTDSDGKKFHQNGREAIITDRKFGTYVEYLIYTQSETKAENMPITVYRYEQTTPMP